MAHQVGAKRGASDGVIALGALKMIHSIAANAAEKGLNLFLPDYGYELDGFHDSLQQPVVNQAVDICLEEIAADAEILQYIESPYTRLAIAWGGALVGSLKKCNKPINRQYAPRMEPRSTHTETPVQPRARGRSDDGQILRGGGPVRANVKSI